MGALVQENGRRLAALSEQLGMAPSLPGWQLRIVDGNHLPASDKRLGALKGRTGAMLPGYSLVVYDPNLEVVVDLLPSEDACQHERVTAQALFAPSQPGQLWIADRNFCATTTLAGWEAGGSGFLVRKQACDPRLAEEGPWQACGRIDGGEVHEQCIATACGEHQWRRIALHLDAATGSGETTIRLWSNLPQYVDSRNAQAHASTARVLRNARRERP
jgi:IS4 transposase